MKAPAFALPCTLAAPFRMRAFEMPRDFSQLQKRSWLKS